MNRQNNVQFSLVAKPRGAAPAYKPQLPGRVPQDFIAAMKLIQGKPGDNPNIRTSDMATKTEPVQRRAVRPVNKWKSSFKPVDGSETSDDKGTGSSEGVELYDPYSSALSDSEMPDRSHCPSDQDNNPGHSLSPPGQLFSCDTRPRENQGFSPGHRLDRQACSPNTDSLDRPGYSSIGRHLDHRLDHRVCSPDRIIHGSSTQRFATSYGGQRTNGEERMTVPEYRREMTTAVRLTPPRLRRDYHHQQEHMETGQDRIKLSTEVTRNSSKIIIMDKNPITCDLCEVELASGQELDDHLDSKSHWDTLEHIQQQNNYDDLAIAFLQEVMLYKSRQCNRAIEDSALQALQENDHMTKVEMFHCAACDVFVSTSASSVQTHITSKDHLSKTKDFVGQQRRACLNKAETIMKELKPQFEHFKKGGSPFE